MSDMGLGALTPEELAELEAYLAQLETDPLARAVNDYGQGSDFLNYSKEPNEWKRVGDKNDLYSDFFRTTKTWLPDWIPDLYPEVEDPGQFQGYRSDKADLYRNNPAYTQLEQFMAEGATFDQAVELVIGDPEFQQFLPKTDVGPDRIGFRNSAEDYVSERAREGREYDTWQAQKDEYDDYVNPRTGESYAPNRMDPETFRATQLRPVDEPGSIGGYLGSITDRIMGAADTARSRLNQPQKPSILATIRGGSTGGRSVLNIDSPKYDGRGRDPRTVTRTSSPSKQVGSFASRSTPKKGQTVSRAPVQTREQRNNMNKAYNKTANSVYERAQQIKAAQRFPSKKQDNLAKLAAYYNGLMYGE